MLFCSLLRFLLLSFFPLFSEIQSKINMMTDFSVQDYSSKEEIAVDIESFQAFFINAKKVCLTNKMNFLFGVGGRKFSQNHLKKQNRGHRNCVEEVAHHTTNMAGV